MIKNIFIMVLLVIVVILGAQIYQKIDCLDIANFLTSSKVEAQPETKARDQVQSDAEDQAPETQKDIELQIFGDLDMDLKENEAKKIDKQHTPKTKEPVSQNSAEGEKRGKGTETENKGKAKKKSAACFSFFDQEDKQITQEVFLKKEGNNNGINPLSEEERQFQGERPRRKGPTIAEYDYEKIRKIQEIYKKTMEISDNLFK